MTPKGWNIKKIKDVGKVVTGNTPPTNDLSNYIGEYKFVSPADLGKDKYILKTEKTLSKKGFLKTRSMPKDSVLYTCIGSTIGKMGIAIDEITSNQQINAVILNKENHYEYFYYELEYKTPQIRLMAGEQAVPLINKTSFEEIEVCMPPLSEQIKIAEVLSTCDAAIDKIQKLIHAKEKQKKGLMQNLLTGKVRFKEFKDLSWEDFEIGELLDYEQPVKFLSEPIELLKEGVPVLTANKSFLLGYTDDRTGVYTQLPVVIFDDFTTDTKFVNFPFKVKSSAIKLLQPKHKNVNLRFVFERMKLIRTNINDHKRRFISEYQFHTISIPSIKEQDMIAEVIEQSENEIQYLKISREKLMNQKKGLMQQLLTGKIRIKA